MNDETYYYKVFDPTGELAGIWSSTFRGYNLIIDKDVEHGEECSTFDLDNGYSGWTDWLYILGINSNDHMIIITEEEAFLELI